MRFLPPNQQRRSTEDRQEVLYKIDILIHLSSSRLNAERWCGSVRRRSFIDRQNMDGETALHMAARFGHGRAVDTLLEFKPSLEITDNDGWIPLHSAVKVDPLIVRAIVQAVNTSKQQVYVSSISRSRRGPSRRCTTMSAVDSTSPEISNWACGIVS